MCLDSYWIFPIIEREKKCTKSFVLNYVVTLDITSTLWSPMSSLMLLSCNISSDFLETTFISYKTIWLVWVPFWKGGAGNWSTEEQKKKEAVIHNLLFYVARQAVFAKSQNSFKICIDRGLLSVFLSEFLSYWWFSFPRNNKYTQVHACFKKC